MFRGYNFLEMIPGFLFIIFLIISIYRFVRKASILNRIMSNWNGWLAHGSVSQEEFYDRVINEVDDHQFSGVKFSTQFLHRGSIFSEKIKYLKVKWKLQEYYVCAAPCGNGFYMSYWLIEGKRNILVRLILAIPFIGAIILAPFGGNSLNYQDTAMMFNSLFTTSFMKVVDEMTNEKGVRSFSELERKPEEITNLMPA